MPRTRCTLITLGAGPLLVICVNVVSFGLDPEHAASGWMVAAGALVGLPALWVWLATSKRRWYELGQGPGWLVLDLFPPTVLFAWLYKLVRRGDSDLS